MKIIIVGYGKVGYTLADQLSGENHDVVIIDNNPSVLQKSQELLDVMIIQGNGASLETQKEADVQHGDVLIAATAADEVNLLCCILARKLGCKSTIARVRNPEYYQQIQFLRAELGLSLSINPEKATANEIYRLLKIPSFMHCETFARGRAELAEFKISEDSSLSGMSLEGFGSMVHLDILVCGIERGDEFVIPNGGFTMQAGDNITVAGSTRDLASLIKQLDLPRTKIRNVIIIGGSRTAVYLAKELLHSHVNVKIIERDFYRCQELSGLLPEALIIHGEGPIEALLVEEGIKSTDAVIPLTDIDEENIIISMYAKYMGVKKVITKIDRIEYAIAFKDKGIDSIIFPSLLTAGEIVRYVRAMGNTSGSEMVSLHKIIDGKAEAMEFHINSSVKYLNEPIMNLKLKKDVLLCCIIRKGKIVIPRGNDVIMENDSVILVTNADRPILDFNDIFL
ncbi:MAG: Trk system potassium transporter TrkA, partial [Lachnospiraceae bacterium]|nr:Trk system potassium transporter TrkA [Lachnospiraceae bacterium]